MTQSYLLITTDQKQVTDAVNHLKNLHSITPFNLFEFQPETSVGIDLVRKIKSQLLSKNTAGYRLLIIYRFETATDEAQNALLKLLEEPPFDTIILLIGERGEKILPTIISRCHLLKTDHATDEENKNTEVLAVLNTILKASPGKRLQIASGYNKNKSDALNFLNLLLRVLDHSLFSSSSDLSLRQLSEVIAKTESARRYLEANVSSKGVIDVLFLGFPRL